jgi:hypothetical protein
MLDIKEIMMISGISARHIFKKTLKQAWTSIHLAHNAFQYVIFWEKVESQCQEGVNIPLES